MDFLFSLSAAIDITTQRSNKDSGFLKFLWSIILQF